MSTVPKRLLTPAEYLAQERHAPFKSEYYQGETFAMAGATREHNLIVGNVVREVGNGLKGLNCEVYPSDMRVKISATGLYTYPDVTVVCGGPEFEDEQGDTLLNPTVLFEILSDSTEAYDRGTKSAHYRRLPSVKEYVLIAQDRPLVERYVRQPDGGWTLREVTQLDQTVELDGIPIQLPMAEIYRQVTLEAESGL
ncbi:MAG TPA: Uma2 family endonuclease [Candidatus Anammoximicrobium sp.]|nr:Uma2 family endonuclease [Candidatus Anammoximicrobium sp.]